MSSISLRRTFPLFILGILTLPTFMMANDGLSHVRVVRLSYVSGTVALKRPGSTERAKAMMNTPLQEGFEISTFADSYVEVEFENGSTARLGESSRMTFDQLALDEDGNKVNRIAFEQGYATFHVIPEHHDSFAVKMAQVTLTPNGKGMFRADLSSSKARVEVFSGSLQIATAANSEKLGKDRVLTFDPGAAEIALNTTTGIVKDPWDKWTNNRDTQAELALSDQQITGHNSVYGWSDLDAYGEWGYFPGYGYGWSPFASSGWAPYNMGMWSFYPGMGYTWISGEPWGWMPYHFGSWSYASSFGWFWMPTGSMAYSPALVNWYSGPGWVGWAPAGVHGVPGQRTVNTTSTSALQNGMLMTPQNLIHLSTTAGTAMTPASLEPGAGARLPGPLLSTSSETTAAAHAGTARNMAPPSILMGGNAAAESSLQGNHFSSPLKARLGTTLGGQYHVGGNLGEFHGDAFKGTDASREPVGPNAPSFGRGSAAEGQASASRGQGSSNSAAMGGAAAMGGRSSGGGNGGGGGGAVNSLGGGGAQGASPVGGRH